MPGIDVQRMPSSYLTVKSLKVLLERFIASIIFISMVTLFVSGQSDAFGYQNKRKRVDKSKWTDVQKKVDHHILDLAKTLKIQRDSLHLNYKDMKSRLHAYSFDMDDKGRFHLNIYLNYKFPVSDTLYLKRLIESVGGEVIFVCGPQKGIPSYMESWIPFDSVESIAKYPFVGNIRELATNATQLER